MQAAEILRTFAAFAITMGLFFGAVWGFRRFAPDVMKRMQATPGKARRMTVVETLVLGPSQRLLLVSLDGAERLVLIGGGQLLDQSMPKKPAPRKVLP